MRAISNGIYLGTIKLELKTYIDKYLPGFGDEDHLGIAVKYQWVMEPINFHED